MNISFIVTCYNIENYVIDCLTSVLSAAKSGDEILIIDDGSKDNTVKNIQRFIKDTTAPDDVTIRPVLLGSNTFGGVGIAANIGLYKATQDTVFFVDGDDWINPKIFNDARKAFDEMDVDIMLANYRLYDDQNHSFAPAADQHLWQMAQSDSSLKAQRARALKLIAVPWRKFYKRAFLQEHKLRFPEGDFYFEDNPFHWAVCQRAGSIGFFNQVICNHRVNRPGQTMGSTGLELLAFFTHYTTILREIASDDTELRLAAMHWLITNMRWHLERMQPAVLRSWGQRAIPCLQSFDAQLWQQHITPTYQASQIGDACDQLRMGDLQGFVTSQTLARLDQKINGLQDDMASLHHKMDLSEQQANVLRNNTEYSALLAVFAKNAPP